MTRLTIKENDKTEFKQCVGKKFAKLPNNLWQSISAFANTHGGTIYLGVDDDGNIKEFSAKELDSLQKDASMLINNKFNIKPKVKISTSSKGYVRLSITEAEFYNKPIFSKKLGPSKIYIRQGSTTVQATNEEMKSLFAGASGGGENQLVSGEIRKIIDAQKVDNYIRRTGLNHIVAGGLEDKLLKIKAVRDGAPTIFGLVAFGKDSAIDEQLNNIYIDFRKFSGTRKVDANDLDTIYTERMEFHGDIQKQFSEAYEYIKTKLPTEAILNSETGLREDRSILPVDAIREALANAIAHRDYLLQSSCVNIDLFADRIEISNPGESLVAIEDLEKASSKARNPNIIEFLKAYNITDKSARGIPTIYQAARNKGLLDPKFENISGIFKATLYFSSPHSETDQMWIDSLSKRYKLKDTQKNALVYIKNTGPISNKEYCEINRMGKRNDDRRARRELAELTNYRLLIKTGVGPGTRYSLSGHYPDK